RDRGRCGRFRCLYLDGGFTSSLAARHLATSSVAERGHDVPGIDDANRRARDLEPIAARPGSNDDGLALLGLHLVADPLHDREAALLLGVRGIRGRGAEGRDLGDAHVLVVLVVVIDEENGELALGGLDDERVAHDQVSSTTAMMPTPLTAVVLVSSVPAESVRLPARSPVVVPFDTAMA